MFKILYDELKRVRKDAGGQSMIFVTLVLVILIIFIALSFNVGDFIVKRVDLQSTADAAALSGAAWAARGLNIIEMLNVVTAWLGWDVFLNNLEWMWWCINPLNPLCEAEFAQFMEALARDTQIATQFTQMATQIMTIYVQIMGWLYPMYIGGMFGWGLNDADWTVPFNMPFLSGIIQDPIVTTGFLDFMFGALPISVINPSVYPDFTFTFAWVHKGFHEEPLWPGVFKAESYLGGYNCMAQARPYGGDPKLKGNPMDFFPTTDWRIQLCPITMDNLILGIVPFLGPIAGFITDFIILH